MPGSINSGIKGNDAYTDGSFSVVAPVWSSMGSDGTLGGGLVYAEPYISWGEGGEVASSLGLGWRYLFSDQPVSALAGGDDRQAGFFEEGWALGASLFLDMLDTEKNNQFWQLGTGVEVMSRYVELRGNYYFPLTGRKETERFRTSETTSRTNTTTSTSYNTQSSASDPYGTGYTIAQDINESVFATTETSTMTTTTTIERLFRRYEEGMEGWDAELAVLLPWIDRWMDVKVVGGYYSFDNQPFGPQSSGTGKVDGWKAGVEVRPVPAIALSALWYQDKKLTGSDWIAGLRVELPFETTNIGDGKGGFWGHIKDAFKSRRRHLAERLAEPVRRQNAAVTLGNVTAQKQSASSTSSTTRQSVTRVVSQSSTQVVLATDVIFVDNTVGVPGNPGTYEAPASTIQGGEDTANVLFGDNGKVFVQGGGASYRENVVVSRSTALYGSGRGMTLANGSTFQGRNATTPVLEGAISASNIGALTVSGFDIRAQETFGYRTYYYGNGYFSTDGYISRLPSEGIAASNVGAVTIIGNRISGTTQGISVIAGSGHAGTVDITENVIANVPGDTTETHGIGLFASSGGKLSGRIADNLVQGYFTGIDLYSTGSDTRTKSLSSIDLTISGNTIADFSSVGILVDARTEGLITARFIGNQFIQGAARRDEIVARTPYGGYTYSGASSVVTYSSAALIKHGVAYGSVDYLGVSNTVGSVTLSGVGSLTLSGAATWSVGSFTTVTLP